MHERDSIGDRLHLLFGCVACMGLLGPQSVTQIAIAPLLVFFFIRAINTFPVWIHGFGQPVVLLTLLLAGWMGVTLLWSGDVRLGLEEISQLRWFVIAGFLYPVIEKRSMLIKALLVGFALAMLGQVIDAFNGFGVELLADYFWHDPNRVSGWFKPVVGGSLFVAGLGLVLPMALLDRGRSQVFGLCASLLMMISIFATGSRGAWIALVVLVVVVFGFGVLTKRIHKRSALIFVVTGGIVLATLFVFAGDTIRQRGSDARQEIAHALDGQYDSETGARIRMAQLAYQATLENPIQGVGAGGYKHWSVRRDPENNRIHDHAHNTLLQLSATAGLPGVLIGFALLGVVLRNGYHAAKRFDTSGFALGPLFGIVGLVAVSMTDVVLISAQSAAMLGLLAALSPAYVPGDEHRAKKS
jgi:O-antigen ligase